MDFMDNYGMKGGGVGRFRIQENHVNHGRATAGFQRLKNEM